jgi:hypothetical protein
VAADAEPAFRLIYVYSSGHSGSTLLDLLLSGHPQIQGLGEVAKFERFRAAGQPDGRLTVEQTAFWREVAAGVEAATGPPARRRAGGGRRSVAAISAGELRGRVEAMTAVYACAARLSGRPYVTDTSKRPRRLHMLLRARACDVRVVHLVRDGRAVVNSYVRKGQPFLPSFGRWARRSLAGLSLPRAHPEVPWLRVRYEDLAARPAETLGRVCRFLQVPVESQMLELRRHSYLGLGGNRMRRQEQPQIVLDEHWKSEFPRLYRIAFAVLGGWLNALYGYL